jgi:hypothetical protein
VINYNSQSAQPENIDISPFLEAAKSATGDIAASKKGLISIFSG